MPVIPVITFSSQQHFPPFPGNVFLLHSNVSRRGPCVSNHQRFIVCCWLMCCILLRKGSINFILNLKKNYWELLPGREKNHTVMHRLQAAPHSAFSSLPIAYHYPYYWFETRRIMEATQLTGCSICFDERAPPDAPPVRYVFPQGCHRPAAEPALSSGW